MNDRNEKKSGIAIGSKDIVTRARSPGATGCGRNLWLIVTGRLAAPGKPSNLRASWVLRFTSPVTKKPREMTLGIYPEISLATARDRASGHMTAIRAGKDPLDERQSRYPTISRSISLEDAAELYIDGKAPGWAPPAGGGTPTSLQAWRSSLRRHVIPRLGRKPARAITVDDIVEVLRPIWQEKHITATRVRHRVEAILSAAAVREGWTGWTNPAALAVVQHFLPSHKEKRSNFAALPFSEAPAFMAKLRAEQATTARALEFLIFTAARPGMVRHARWQEIDEAGRIWHVPPESMKLKQPFRIPLSSSAMGVLDSMRPWKRSNSSPIFPGNGKRGEGISENAMRALLVRMQVANCTAHGFRSTFRDWGGETTGHPSDVLDVALDHALPGGETRLAYQRKNLLEKRRVVMEEWAGYLLERPEAGPTLTRSPVRPPLRGGVGTGWVRKKLTTSTE